MQKPKQLSLAFILLLFVISGCNFTSSRTNMEQDKKDAEKVTNKFFDLIKRKSYDSIYPLFDKKFLEATPKEKMQEIFTATQNKLGDLETTNLENWETRVVTGTTSLAEYKLQYANHHKKYDSKEIFTLTRDDDGKIRIVSYNINSEGFFK